jgi:hypothetical protein
MGNHQEAPLTEALRSRYPGLDGSQRGGLAAAILREVADAISGGQHVGYLSPQPDGSVDITLFAVVREQGDAGSAADAPVRRP